MPPRAYTQHVRAESAAKTQRRILDAVYNRLREAPAERITVDGVARTAGVSRATVYLVFGDRSGMFDAIGSDLLERNGFSEVMRAVEEPNPRVALEQFFQATTQLYAHSHDVLRSLFAMAQLDPNALGGAIQRIEEGRNRGIQLLAQRLADEGQLLDNSDTTHAADLLSLLSSFPSYDLLATVRGRTPQDIARLYLATLTHAALRPAATPPAAASITH